MSSLAIYESFIAECSICGDRPQHVLSTNPFLLVHVPPIVLAMDTEIDTETTRAVWKMSAP